MRVLGCLLAASVFTTVASADLLQNEDFNLGDDNWGATTATEWGGRPIFILMARTRLHP